MSQTFVEEYYPTMVALAKLTRAEHVQNLRHWARYAPTTKQQRELYAAAHFIEGKKKGKEA